MYKVNLDKLAKTSEQVSSSSFGSLDDKKMKEYIEWVKQNVKQKDKKRITNVGDWIKLACEKTVVLMGKGVDDYTTWAAKELSKLPPPLYPILNEEWKSDAWLTGLVWAKLRDNHKISLNKQCVGFALSGKEAGSGVKLAKSVQLQGEWDAVIIDDASYSGTQAWTLLQNLKFCGGFKQLPDSAVILLAGASKRALDKLQRVSYAMPKAMTPMPDVPDPTMDVAEDMRTLPGYGQHIELNPKTLTPGFTKGEMFTFMDISYAILPYKIPDSISVPTHVYCAYRYKPKLFKKPIRHLFKGEGAVSYRTVMPKGAELFAELI
jgi:hypothetical protein